MFGQGYTERASLQLAAGEYTARINHVEQFNRGGYSGIDIILDIKGHPGYKPDRISFFDRPTDPEKMAGWDARMTTFFKAFKINPGDFNFNSWNGKIGTVRISQNKRNPQYMDVFPVIASSQQQSAPQYEPQRQQQAPHEEQFQDDIPF